MNNKALEMKSIRTETPRVFGADTFTVAFLPEGALDWLLPCCEVGERLNHKRMVRLLTL